MAKTARGRLSWLWRGSPIGRKGPRKANPKYTRDKNKNWSASDVRRLRQLARDNTPTRVIGLKLGRSETSVRGKAQRELGQVHAVDERQVDDRRLEVRERALAGEELVAGRADQVQVAADLVDEFDDGTFAVTLPR